MGVNVNIDEIIKKSGVSRSTVFRFLRGDNVRDNAKNAIMDAMNSLGYEDERLIGKSLGFEIEISTAEYTDDFLGFTHAIKGITDAAEKFGINVRIVKRSGAQIPSAYKSFGGNKGVIVIGKNLDDERLEAERLVEKEIPHIFINRVFSNPNVSFVSADLVQAAFDITKYFIDKGHKKIAVLGDVGYTRPDRDKIEGYKKAMSESEIEVSENLCFTDVNASEIEQYMEGYFKNGEKPDAFIGICDTYAMKFIRIAEKHGYSVPEDIAVAGMDDVVTGELFRPALTTVHIPFYEMGYLAVDAIVKQARKNVKSTRTIVRHNIIKRQSSR